MCCGCMKCTVWLHCNYSLVTNFPFWNYPDHSFILKWASQLLSHYWQNSTESFVLKDYNINFVCKCFRSNLTCKFTQLKHFLFRDVSPTKNGMLYYYFLEAEIFNINFNIMSSTSSIFGWNHAPIPHKLRVYMGELLMPYLYLAVTLC